MYDTIVCFGDSLTQHGWDVSKQGWTAQLAQAYLRKMDIVNRGFSGYNTKLARVLLPQILPPSDPGEKLREVNEEMADNMVEPGAPVSNEPRPGPKLRLLVIFFGANDAQVAPGKAHVPLDEFRTNIEYFVLSIKLQSSAFYSKDTRVLLITPPALGTKQHEHYEALDGNPSYRTNEVTKQYADAVKEAADKLQVPCVDLWSAIEDKVAKVREERQETGEPLEFEGYDEYLRDGLHLSAKGNDLLFELVTKKIKECIPELDPESMTFVVPRHQELYANINDFEKMSCL
ncbi:isoamyl acetate-hydrolyzing esterase [Coemansia spiralis]|uniref:Isoamyl acetate-hydrolyzing esterase n=2 Tax=Coemansia TaxID=4863 RepID=A0A9W8GB08_9FUNG|nr:isoamyl acetate-hydrolyzing esterase [Coemansia umbellata]KAJ2624477.1 isoamyl acetate-hydrolyzing esterase [Coemansia sp. RSA 1358]KAJ2679558.1 isoamyl acetate-hydrolyzing esterase [Coemansia spiralis]